MILMVTIYCDNCAIVQVMYGIGFSVLISSIGLEYFCMRLWKAIRKNNMDGLIKLVKTGNFTLAGFEIL